MHRLSSLALALCTGCGALFAHVSSSGMDHAVVRPEEADAVLYCGGRPCEAASLQREYRGRLSKVGYVAGTAADAAVLGLTFSRGRSDELLGATIIALFVTISDIEVPLENRGFDGTADPWTLRQPVSADFRGQRADLSVIDLVENGEPRCAFSLAALQRLQRDATVSWNGGICLRRRDAAGPGGYTVVAIFDAMNEAADLHPEDIRSLSDVLRATAAAVAPEARVAGPRAMAAGVACDQDCMAQRIGATFTINGTLRDQGDGLQYSVRALNVSSGAVVAEATASGKTLGDLAAAVRKMAARLFACGE